MKLKLVALFAATAASALAQLNITTGTNVVAGRDTDWSVSGGAIIGSTLGWVVNEVPAGYPVGAPWLGYTGTGPSLWLSPNNLNGATQTSTAPASFTWTRTFFIATQFELDVAQLVYKTATDNNISDARLNGNLLVIPPQGAQYLAFTDTSVVSTGFVLGLNTLTFTVENTLDNVQPGDRNPSGFRLEGEVTFNAVPEPSTYGMIAAALLGVGIWAKRRRNA